MDTRWRDFIKKGYLFLQKRWISIPGLALMIFGVFGFGILISYRRYYATKTILSFGLLMNVFIGIGISLMLRRYLERKYTESTEEEKFDFEEWKKSEAYSLKQLYKVLGIACLGAFWYMFDLVAGKGMWGGGRYYNYASGYVLVITVLIQFSVAWRALRKFWYGKLEAVFGQMEARLQLRLAEALEIERKSLEKVSRSDQLRVDLITNVSHDLKTPLTSMVGYIELIKKEELSNVVRDYVEVVSARTEKLKEMINSLFSLAKAGSGNVELKKENFEVNRLIDQIFADMEDQVKGSELEFVIQLTKEDTKVYSDNMYFYRICQNLIENTLKYYAKGTRVFVKTYLKERTDGTDLLEAAEGQEAPRIGKKNICIEVTNTAKYFMDFTKEDIVERFVRGEKSRTSDGNGLGIAIVSTYAKALGGEFDIRIDCDQFKACLEFAF